jgi:putative FmdB family regulatory protein
MPTYDFECVKCHHRFEEKRSFSDNGNADCPRCHCQARRLFTPAPIIFKGSGFYVTDHRKAGTEAADSTGKATKTQPKEPKKETKEVKDVKAATTE